MEETTEELIKIKTLLKIVIALIIGYAITFYIGIVAYNEKILNKLNKLDTKEVSIKLDQPEYLLSNNPEEDLIDVLYHYNVQYPEIVYAQAVLETGNFNSRVFREYNNLFGLYNSYEKDYYKFDHWVESVLGYINFIQYRYKEGEDYYDFLIRIGYAEDPKYIDKVKSIVNQLDTKTSLQNT